MGHHYKDLIAWQKSMDLANAIYDATEAFPKRETYSLTDQMRRAAVSIPSNILRKGRDTSAGVSFVTFFDTPADPWPNSKLKLSLHKEEIILLNRRQQKFLNARMKWGA
jgi:hypothetical protein